MSSSPTLLISGVYHGLANARYDGSSDEFETLPIHGSAYYLSPASGSQTVALSLNEFQGQIEFLATLDTDEATATWTEVYVLGDFSTRLTENIAVNIRGNFTWIKARVVGFEHGVINEIRIAY